MGTLKREQSNVTLDLKFQPIEDAERGVKKTGIVEKYGGPKNTLSSWLKAADKNRETHKVVHFVKKKVHSELQHFQPRLVAVSKTKPVAVVKEAYACGQRHFGENYVNELLEKSADEELNAKCSDINWHFIGHLQRNKVGKVLGVPNLYMVETIDSEKLAAACNSTWERLENPHRLKVMVQINTSGEDNKHGVDPKGALNLADFVRHHCPQLELSGFMTIGAFDHDLSSGPNPDFQNLIKVKDKVCAALKLDPLSTELSMGMSNDFEHAIINGSANVRVGSTIFGARVVKKAAETTEGKESSKKS